MQQNSHFPALKPIYVLIIAAFSSANVSQIALAENKAEALETGTIEVISTTPYQALARLLIKCLRMCNRLQVKT